MTTNPYNKEKGSNSQRRYFILGVKIGNDTDVNYRKLGRWYNDRAGF